MAHRSVRLALGALALLVADPAGGGSGYGPPLFQPTLPAWTLAPDEDPAGTDVMQNGSFETGGFDQWFISRVGHGTIYVTADTTGKFSGNPVIPTTHGAVQAVVDQNGPGRQIIFQDVFVPTDHEAELSFVVWVINYAGTYANAGTLDYRTVAPNQHVRVDLIDRFASFEEGAVLKQIFRTGFDDPNFIPPTRVRADVSEFSGQVIRLRFAEVDNQDHLTVGFDDVRLVVRPTTPTRPVSWGRVKAAYR